MKRIIFHVDVNSAFLSWESARRVAEGKDDLRLIPAAIGGDRDKRTGVILAKSIPAKQYHIRTGEAVVTALKKCPNLVLAKPDFSLYETCSAAFMNICRRYTPALEKYSIDECFLDMTGTENLYPDMIKTAHEIKDTIRRELGFTVNIGIGPNKILAKMAGDFEKPDKVHTLTYEEIPQKLWPLPIRDLLSVGRSTAEKLTDAGYRTIGDLAGAKLSEVQAIIGNKAGLQLHRYANGIDDAPVCTEPEDAKSYGVSTTLEKDVTTFDEAKKILLSLADSVSSRMRADKTKAYCVGVTIRNNDFKNKSHQKKLTEPTDVTRDIYELSKTLFLEMWKKTPLRLIGISLSDLVKEGEEQISLFENREKEKKRNADKAVDAIRSRFGTSAVKPGAILHSPNQVGKKYQAQMESLRSDISDNKER